jgi:hypothetical protein
MNTKQYKLLVIIFFALYGFDNFPSLRGNDLMGSNPVSTEKVDRVLIHLKNVSHGNSLIPGSNGIVKLQRRRFRQEAQTLDAMASFYQVPVAGDYSVTGLHHSQSSAFDNAIELWGQWDQVNISPNFNEFIFERNMPYILDVQASYFRENMANPSLEINDELTLNVLMKNPSGQTMKTKLVVLLKNAFTQEVIRLEDEVVLHSSQLHHKKVLTYQVKSSGEYHFAAGIFLEQRINQWSDCWDWSEDPMFFVSKEHRTIEFAGYTWDVKAGFGNPGSNFWANDSSNVWIDGLNRLNLTLSPKDNGRWYATEVISQQTFGFGTYTFFIDASPAEFDPHVVAAIFLFKDEENEIDIEFSRWGDKENYQFGNYVVQPAEYPGNHFRFPILTNGSYTTHRIEWMPDQIVFSSWHGHYPEAPEGKIISQWQYAGDHVPDADGIKLFFNIWLFRGIQPKSDASEIFTIAGFDYQPIPNPNPTLPNE